jgi:hypothetical protein
MGVVPTSELSDWLTEEQPRVSIGSVSGIGLPELPAPISHGFIGQHDPTFGHQFFDVPVAQAKTEVQPDTVTDNLPRETMTLIGVGYRWWIHAASMPYKTGAGK